MEFDRCATLNETFNLSYNITEYLLVIGIRLCFSRPPSVGIHLCFPRPPSVGFHLETTQMLLTSSIKAVMKLIQYFLKLFSAYLYLFNNIVARQIVLRKLESREKRFLLYL